MRALVLGVVSAVCLYGASGDSQSVLNEVSKLRVKYEECLQSQNGDSAHKIKGYQKRIATLEGHIKENMTDLKRLTEHSKGIEQELARKKGVIRSLEKTLTSRDEQYRAAVARNEQLTKQANAIKVGKIERENLTKALAKAKEEIARLQHDLKKSSPAGVQQELESARKQIAQLRKELSAEQSPKTKTAAAPVESEKVKALQRELENAKRAITQLQNTPPSVKEKVVTRVVEPTEKLVALQRELNTARAEIANLKNNTPKQVVKEKIVEKVVYRDKPATKMVEKVVYKDRVVTQEKVVYKEKPVEKIVYKDRPVVQEKIVTKMVEPTEKIHALQTKLAQAESQIAKLKADSAVSKSKRPAAAASAAPVREVHSAVKTTSAEPAKKVAAATPPTPKKKGSSAYRMASNAPIYSAPSGAVVDNWEARRSFTAGEPSSGWVRITGYFVNRVWQPTREGENLWVRESDVIRR